MYRGFLETFGTDAAVKCFREAPDHTDALSFRKESLALAKFRHPNVLQLLGVSVDGPHLCLVTAFMGGGSLRSRLVNSSLHGHAPLTMLQRVLALHCAARGLTYLHTKLRVVHRDIKASNILFDEGTSRAVLADFGLVRDVQKHDHGLTDKTQMPSGTAAYMSPEATKGKITTAMDVYAFGITILETLAGRPAEASGGGEDLFLEAEEALEDLSTNPQEILKFVDSIIQSENQNLLLDLFTIVGVCTDTRHRQRPEMPLLAERLSRIFSSLSNAQIAPQPKTQSLGRDVWCSKDQKGLDEKKTFTVPEGCPEYNKIASRFSSTMQNAMIDQIERVENGYQFEAHDVKVRAIIAQLGAQYKDDTMRRLLFHGTRCRGDVLGKIVNDPDAGFLPLKSGSRTGAKWGDGTYFARDAKYSNEYATRLPTGQKQMIVADVIVGRWTLGSKGLNECPIIEGEQFVRYNSLVNDVKNPSIFVVQHSSQAYPAYVITYHINQN